MKEPRWLAENLVDAIHEELIAEHGGLGGVRDPGLLESALARPRQLLAYGSPTLFELAAGYAVGIVRNHPFVDGNKRTAFMSAYVFLRINGYRLDAAEVEAVAVFQDLAASELDEAALAVWLERNAKPVDE